MPGLARAHCKQCCYCALLRESTRAVAKHGTASVEDSSSKSEFDFGRVDHRVVPLRRLEIVAGRESEFAGEHGAGELANPHVVDFHAVVVALAGDLDAVFGSGELVLQAEEVLVGLQFGIVLGDGPKLANAT